MYRIEQMRVKMNNFLIKNISIFLEIFFLHFIAIESPESVAKFFLDRTGKHLFVTTDSNEFYYYSRQTKKFKAINKLKVDFWAI